MASTTESRDHSTPVTTGPPKVAVNWPVFIGSGVGIMGIIIWALIDQEGADEVIGTAVSWVATNLGWFYILLVTIVLVFVLWAAMSGVGRVKLGPDHSKPVYNLFSWTAMLFAAGIGIDLMFFSVAEPITQYLAPPVGDGETAEAARQALAWTLFHYGIIGWALYALMGMALGYFAYRHNLPLSIRSALYPIFGKRVEGGLGNFVDIAALLGAIFGLATSLGIGVAQLNVGLDELFGIPKGNLAQAGLIAVAVVIATLSAVAGIDKGVRRLSELNVIVAIGLMLFILIAGSTAYLFDGIVQNVGDFASRFPGMTLNTFAYDRPDEWLSSWTLFFWAWWIAWAPFVGLFLARISRGRTIRQFVLGTLTVPFLFILVWISIFGNSAIEVVRGGNAEFGETAVSAPEQAFYGLLDEYPAAPLLIVIATLTGLLFYVTSADSGALVMSHFSSRMTDNESDGPAWVRIFWAAATGLLTLAMLMIGGITTLQNATIIMGIPFALVMVFIMLGLFKALQVERNWAASARLSLPKALSTRGSGGTALHWRQRIERSVRYPDVEAAERYATTVVGPALGEVAEELTAAGRQATVGEQVVDTCGIHAYHLDVAFDGERPFHYQVYPTEHLIPQYGRLPSSPTKFFRLEVFSADGSNGFDVFGFTKDQLISNVLDHYERHLEFLHRSVGADSTAVDAEPVLDWSQDFESIPTEDDDVTARKEDA
ncbi:choline BCCT transporter BetT [Gordonia rubripertincta]|uniref:Choline BCCT transporter BetT n=1 Tax=Gordonia rubripertincta TaxID=36822 RepID=A0ABT4N2T4_GORRU|nr:choline BCCT transporter BetT [Gordonia rubripertincta]MCZ4553590.1 choline BCCT transporter BetT [Gordonia rubripertincta]